MLRKLKITIMLVCSICIIVFSLSGFSTGTSGNSWGSSCQIYLDNLPSEYEQLSAQIRDTIEISVSLRNTSSNKKYKAILSDKNGFRQTLDLNPGTYEVYYINISNKLLAMFHVHSSLKSIQVTKDSQTQLPVSIDNPDDLIKAIKNSQPTKEILAENIYSRKVQYNGNIIDLNTINKSLEFPSNINKRLAPGEVAYIPSTSDSTVSIMVQNKQM